MKGNYCLNCGKEIAFKEILMQSIMFGVYCKHCGEVSVVTTQSKIIFTMVFIFGVLVNIIMPINGFLKVFSALSWCIIMLWFIQPIFCKFK
ncbi:MAG: hypothetical protein ACRC41_05310 [Sarcina sp.]